MSSRPTGDPAPSAPKEKKRFNKFLSRAKTVLRRGESSKRQSVAPKPGSGPETVVKTAPALPPHEEARAKYASIPGVSRLSKAEMFEERAKKLGERFGLEIKATEWKTAATDDTVLRMDKPIRMRVRRTCHKCNANFAFARECPNCQHIRCVECARYPPKLTEEELIASREKRALIIKANKENAPIIPDFEYDGKKEYTLKRPSKTPGGRELVYKKPRQRVRRTCHECQTLFLPGSKLCEECGHVRCTDCPRNPPKKDKYPLGYPGDEFGPNSVPHFECEQCRTLFPTGSENGTPCARCGKHKSDDSPRAQPRKVEPEPDPEILKLVQARLQSLKVA